MGRAAMTAMRSRRRWPLGAELALSGLVARAGGVGWVRQGRRWEWAAPESGCRRRLRSHAGYVKSPFRNSYRPDGSERRLRVHHRQLLLGWAGCEAPRSGEEEVGFASADDRPPQPSLLKRREGAFSISAHLELRESRSTAVGRAAARCARSLGRYQGHLGLGPSGPRSRCDGDGAPLSLARRLTSSADLSWDARGAQG